MKKFNVIFATVLVIIGIIMTFAFASGNNVVADYLSKKLQPLSEPVDALIGILPFVIGLILMAVGFMKIENIMKKKKEAV